MSSDELEGDDAWSATLLSLLDSLEPTDALARYSHILLDVTPPTVQAPIVEVTWNHEYPHCRYKAGPEFGDFMMHGCDFSEQLPWSCTARVRASERVPERCIKNEEITVAGNNPTLLCAPLSREQRDTGTDGTPGLWVGFQVKITNASPPPPAAVGEAVGWVVKDPRKKKRPARTIVTLRDELCCWSSGGSNPTTDGGGGCLL